MLNSCSQHLPLISAYPLMPIVTLSAVYEELIAACVEYFSSTGINYIDATPFVLQAFQADTRSSRIFYPRGDGHPFVNGYQSYARAEALTGKISPQ